MAASNWEPLRAYVMAFGGFNQPEAEQWLDSHCPRWRTGPAVTARHPWVLITGSEQDDEQ
ncbi:hypothetical protein D3C85_1678060 [compost metagenome]